MKGQSVKQFYERKIYDAQNSVTGTYEYVVNIPRELDVIYAADSRDMSAIPNDSVHLMITSPPYNVGKDYDDDLSMEEYLDLLRAVLTETYRVLVLGGRMCINTGLVGRKPTIPLHMYLNQLAIECGFLMRAEIIWDKGMSVGPSCAWGSWKSASNPVMRDVHEYIGVFSKGDYRRQIRGEDTIGRDEFLEYTKSIWRFKTANAKALRHPAPFPIELPKRLMELYSFAGDVVLDPFMGSGTTAVAANLTRRRYIGYEIEPKYIAVAETRLAGLQ